MRLLRALPLLCAQICLQAADYFAAPDGRAGAAGSNQEPWSLEYALSSAEVQPGDTIWLRGGVYSNSGVFESSLRGTASEPVTLRQFPGERAALMGGLRLAGAYTLYWGFEVFETARTAAPEQAGAGNRLIHLVMHTSSERPALLEAGAEATGCLWYDDAGAPHFTDTGKLSPYERGRANVVARWNMAANRSEINASDLLKPGAAYELYDARAIYGPPVARGIFNGNKIALSNDDNPERRLLVLMPGRKSETAERAAGATFLGIDTTTKGNWRGVYGQDGNYIAYHSYGYPSYSYPSTNAADVFLLSNTSSDPRALQRYLGDPSLRVAAYAHTVTSMDWTLPATDGLPHRVALYFCDYQNLGRSISVDVIDNATSAVLDTRLLPDISGGVYLVYTYNGTVKFRVRNNLNSTLGRTATAPLSAIFWGGTGVPVVDTTPPDVNVTAPADQAVVLGTVALTANATDNVAVAGVQFKVDNTNFGAEDTSAPYNINWNTVGLSNGTHTIAAVARDTSGLTRTSALVTVTVNNPPPDTTLPDVSINSPTGGTLNGVVNISGIATDNAGVVGIQLKLDNVNLGAELPGPGPAFNYNWNTALATNGAHSLTAVARDAAGNFRTSTAVSVTVNNPDTQPPSVSITSPAAGAVAGTISINANASDNVAVAGVQFKIDNVNLGAEDTSAPYTIQWNTAGVTDGSHTISAVVRDGAGLTATAAVNVTVNNTNGVFANFIGRDDSTRGDWRGIYGQDGHYIVQHSYGVAPYSTFYSNTANQLVFEVVSADPRALLRPNASYGTNERIKTHFYSRYYVDIDISTTDNQPHRLGLYFCDYDYRNRSITVSMRDTVTGQVLDSRLLDNYSGGVYFVYNYRGRVTLRIQNNYPPFDPTTGQPTLPNGTISALFWGGSGLPGAPDTTLPTVSITNPLPGATVSGTTSVNMTATDNTAVAGVELKLDNTTTLANLTGSGPAFSYSWNTAGVANGMHTLSAIARDAAGNANTASINVNVNNFVDTQPPGIQILSPANGATVLNTIPIQVSATDNGTIVGVQYKIDNVNLGAEVTTAPYTGSWNTATVGNGSHTITAVVRDAAGLTGSASVNVTVNNFIDTVPPGPVSFLSPAAGATVSGDVSLQASASDNVGVVDVQYILDGSINIGSLLTTAPYSFTWNSASVGNGNHTLTVRARDAAGLTGTAIINVTVNNVNPPGTFVTYLGQDLNTKGNWKGVYGQDGHLIAQNSYLYASYAAFNPRNVGNIVQNWYSTDPRALYKNVGQFSSTERIASYLYGAPVAELDMRTNDNQPHRVALYFADFENLGRSITVEARDAATNAVLDTRVLSNYTNGVYLVYQYKGPITFRIIKNLTGTGTLSTISGVFWGGAGLP